MSSRLTPAVIREHVVPQLLAAIPKSWLGTTFNNSHLLGREGFSKGLITLMESKADAKVGGEGAITTDDLLGLGNAEDYLRVSSNVSTTYEVILGLARGLSVSCVFTFASTSMPVVAVALAAHGTPVHLYTGDAPAPFAAKEVDVLKHVGGIVHVHSGAPVAHPDGIVLVLEAGSASSSSSSSSPSSPSSPAAGVGDGAAGAGGATGGIVDGVVGDCTLFIQNPGKIDPAGVLTIRKRTATPLTTPVVLARMQQLAGLPSDADSAEPDKSGLEAFLAHLQTMSGTEVNPSSNPVTFTAGLPTIASLWLGLVARGGANILMASTAYGGSSQLTDILVERADTLSKHTFDLQGDAPINPSIRTALDALASDPSGLKPVTVMFVEIPTNPDQKVPDIPTLTSDCMEYQSKTGKTVLLLVDTTFAPGSAVLRHIRDSAPDLAAMCFISMSKSVSRGLTTAGALVGNHTSFAMSVIADVHTQARTLDTVAKRDQLVRLIANHEGVEERCKSAYEVAVRAGNTLTTAVKTATGVDMPLAYVTPETAALGFTSSTFSFNLPPPTGASPADLAALAQRFVDLLTADALFKPCVSFGQDNGLVYCTVPATSTQGAISEEHKAKQAKGGVQLVRLSFPPTIDVDTVCARIEGAVQTVYSS